MSCPKTENERIFWCTAGLLAARVDVLLVRGCVHQPVELRAGRDLQLREPPRAERVLRERSLVVRETGVDLDDLARDRGEDLADGLHRLDLGELAFLLDLLSLCRQVHEDQLPQV